jgi:hypothetical protein
MRTDFGLWVNNPRLEQLRQRYPRISGGHNSPFKAACLV